VDRTERAADVVVVLTTLPVDAEAEGLAETLVTEGLAACVAVGAPMTSIYTWEGALERQGERQLVIKTARDRVAALESRLRALHPYDVPEFLVLAVSDGAADYLDWIVASTRTSSGPPRPI
jgi:periplasmic divalent cation tolerance protein